MYYPGSGPNRIVEYYNDAYTSTNSPADKNQYLKIYPNPSDGVLNVKVSDNFIGKKMKVISFSSGKSVLNQTINSSKTSLDIHNLSAGQYYISLANNKGTITKVFVKK